MAVVAALGLAIGLLVAQPWGPPSLPSVRNLHQVGENWTTVTLRWDPPSGAPPPDEYTIDDSSGNGVGDVNGNVTTYTITGLQVGSAPGAYSVSAVWDGDQSGSPSSVHAVTRQPPLNSDYAMSYDNTSSPGGTMTVGTYWTDDWTFSPSCSRNTCEEGLQANFDPPATTATPFTVTLKPSGGHYAGTTHDEIFACSGGTSTDPFLQGGAANDTVNVDIAPVHTSGGVWTSFTGTVLVTAPYAIASNPSGIAGSPISGGIEYCPAQSWTFSVSGHPSS